MVRLSYDVLDWVCLAQICLDEVRMELGSIEVPKCILKFKEQG